MLIDHVFKCHTGPDPSFGWKKASYGEENLSKLFFQWIGL